MSFLLLSIALEAILDHLLPFSTKLQDHAFPGRNLKYSKFPVMASSHLNMQTCAAKETKILT